MRMIEKHGKLIGMSAAALALTAVLTVESSMAYFTTYVSAGGKQIVHLGAQTDIEEPVSNKTKHVKIKNTSEDNDCYVRVKVFSVEPQLITYEHDDNWYFDASDDPVLGGYWYYRPILSAKGETSILDVKIDLDGFNEDEVNVVVIYECTPVIYGENGDATCDWEQKLNFGDASAAQGEEDERE